MQDSEFKKFHSGLCPTLPDERIIGVRTPQLRKLAKELIKSGEYKEFLASLPHSYYEENQIHGFIISEIKDYDEAIRLTDEFLPYVDNWATCDRYSGKAFIKNDQRLINDVIRWMSSEQVYTKRYGIGMLMSYFLDEGFRAEYLRLVADIKSDEYYINMMIAWFFATALSKQYDETVLYLKEKHLPVWVHNKTVQKAVESYRITKEQKEFLRTLRIK